MISVEIDSKAGFCGGVIKTIGTAEKFLSDKKNGHLYSLGEIVHNESEIERLSAMGLIALDEDDISDIKDARGENILIRAHGQPPATYAELKSIGFNIIDCTCPVVLGIQKKIRQSHGMVIIFGKKGHPEVLGLVGQVEEERVRVIENMEDALQLAESGETISECEIFSQTTKSPVEYAQVCDYLKGQFPKMKVHQTICSQVRGRYEELKEFAAAHDVIVFVSGKASSNGKVLSSLCKSVNIRSYLVGGISEIQSSWFRQEDKVGISGATSTPRWLLEQVADHIRCL